MKLFERTKPSTKFMVVELEKPRSVPEFNGDVASSIATLQGHPGFQYLLQKLRLQRAALRSALCNQRHKAMSDVEFLQSGIAWTGWLEQQLTKAIGFKEPALAEPYKSERDAFEEQARFLEILR